MNNRSLVETNGDKIKALREEVARLLADALRVADDTATETARQQHLQDDEMGAAAKIHDAEMSAAQGEHDTQVHHLESALASRDVLGQAKGIIMVTMNCDADTAFDLIRKQSQAENRKAIDVAAEIVARVVRRAAG